MSAEKPRAAYCTGCGVTFKKMHLLRQHRGTARCGGRFLPEEKRTQLQYVRLVREAKLRTKRLLQNREKFFEIHGYYP